MTRVPESVFVEGSLSWFSRFNYVNSALVGLPGVLRSPFSPHLFDGL